MSSARYVYALVRPAADLVPHLPGTGVLGAEVRLVPASDGTLAALVSAVDADRFGADALQGGIADLAWLEPVARAHDAVVNAAARHTVTIPFRLGTTCPDDGAVVDLLADVAAAAGRALDRVAGCHEWTVHVLGAPTRSAVAGRPTGETGAGYLARRRAELDGDSARRERDAADAERVFRAGDAVAAASRRHPAQDARLRSDPRPMLLNVAFLVDDRERDRFLTAVRDAAEAIGADRVTVSGPWACYSFARLAEPETDGSIEPADAGATP